MIDKLGHEIRVGDILIQGSGEWGVHFYEVLVDPDTTARLRARDLRQNHKPALSKSPKYYLNLSALLHNVMDSEEIERRIVKGVFRG